MLGETNSSASLSDYVVRNVRVGPFCVADATSNELADYLVKENEQQRIAYALHVGGLNARTDERFVQALNRGTLLYADGVAVVLLAKLAGASRITRTPTTDFGWTLINRLSQHLRRRVSLAIIGGPPGLAEAAGQTLTTHAPVDVIHCSDGYQDDYSASFELLRTGNPDIILVGMGMPKEAKWVDSHRHQLPDALIVTCGGWLGFLAGHEMRAPRSLQRLGLEWLYRLIQAPSRLIGRYTKGIWSTASLVPAQLRARVEKSRRK